MFNIIASFGNYKYLLATTLSKDHANTTRALTRSQFPKVDILVTERVLGRIELSNYKNPQEFALAYKAANFLNEV